jgi:hypothetical protein
MVSQRNLGKGSYIVVVLAGENDSVKIARVGVRNRMFVCIELLTALAPSSW